jgi:hypothetical protein
MSIFFLDGRAICFSVLCNLATYMSGIRSLVGGQEIVDHLERQSGAVAFSCHLRSGSSSGIVNEAYSLSATRAELLVGTWEVDLAISNQNEARAV